MTKNRYSKNFLSLEKSKKGSVAMSFGGSVQAMITSLKNNARKSRRTVFDAKNNSTSSTSAGIPVEEISQEQLQAIKTRMQEERKQKNRKIVFVFLLSLLLIVTLVITLLSIYF